jgi:hypothetical protein
MRSDPAAVSLRGRSLLLLGRVRASDVARPLSQQISRFLSVSRPASTALNTTNRFCSLLFNVTITNMVTFSLLP